MSNKKMTTREKERAAELDRKQRCEWVEKQNKMHKEIESREKQEEEEMINETHEDLLRAHRSGQNRRMFTFPSNLYGKK